MEDQNTNQSSNPLGTGTQVQQSSSGGVVTTAKKMPGTKVIIVGAILIAILAAAYYYYAYVWKGVGSEEAVAIVNGEVISKQAFDENVATITETASLQGINVEDESIRQEIKTQALDGLVNNALLIQGATNAGITTTAEEIETEYRSLETQVGGAEELAKRMAEVGLSEEKLRSNISDQLTVNAYLESKIDPSTITVTDEEVQAFIDSINVEGAELPPIEEIRPQIEAQIQSQKQQELILDLLEKLKAEAEVEILL